MARKTVKYLNMLRDDLRVKYQELELQANDTDEEVFELCQLTLDDIRYGTEHEDQINAVRRSIDELSRELTSFESAVKTYKEFF